MPTSPLSPQPVAPPERHVEVSHTDGRSGAPVTSGNPIGTLAGRGLLSDVVSGDAPASPQERPDGQDARMVRSHGREGAPVEIGGRNGPEPTRFGDWEKGGRCIDF